MIETLIVGAILGTTLYLAKNWFINAVLSALENFTIKLFNWHWKEALKDSDSFAIVFDVIMGLLASSTLINGGQMGIAALVIFGLWTFIGIKTRKTRKAVTRGCKRIKDGIIALREELPI